MKANTAQDFWAKVHKTESCWLWGGHLLRTGYALFTVGGSKAMAHRYAYELQYGPIPFGMQIDHKCRVRHCVNHNHLRLATNAQNKQNQSGARADSTGGVKGVQIVNSEKARAHLGHNGIRYHGPWRNGRDAISEAMSDRKLLEDKYFTHHERGAV